MTKNSMSNRNYNQESSFRSQKKKRRDRPTHPKTTKQRKTYFELVARETSQQDGSALYFYCKESSLFSEQVATSLSELSSQFDLPIEQARFWDNCFLIWKPIVLGIDYRNLPSLKYINNFLSSHITLTEKVSLLKSGLAAMGKDFFEVHPETYVVPTPDPIYAFRVMRGDIDNLPTPQRLLEERTQIKRFGKWITKPSNSYGGKEIKIFSRYEDMLEHVSDLQVRSIVQKCIATPLLLDGRKFDVRAHVLLTPTKMWYSSIMYLRQAPEKYDPSSDDSSKQLTNISLHKNSKNIHPFKESGCAPEEVFEFIRKLKPLFEHAQSVEQKYRVLEEISFETFELIGLDILFDSDRRPWLLEINKDPSFRSIGVHAQQGSTLIGDALKEIVFHPLYGIDEATSFTEF